MWRPSRWCPGLIDEPAWPTLRAHLLLLAAHGTDPVTQLAAAAGSRELNTADDRAAVLDWRLDDTGHRNAGQGPLPWLPGIPQGLRDHPVWGNYLAARSDLARTLADQIRAAVADTDPPAWATQRGAVVPRSVIGDVQVWRAAMQVSPDDRRPTGAVQLQKSARTWQVHLDSQVAGDRALALQEWGWLLNQLSPNLTQDPFAPMLADRLAAISRTGVDARQLLRSALSTGGQLPDDHAAAAVWWRISRHLTPAVAAQADTRQYLHHGLDLTAGRANRRRPGRQSPVQRVVATARYCCRPRPAARLAARRPSRSRRHARRRAGGCSPGAGLAHLAAGRPDAHRRGPG